MDGLITKWIRELNKGNHVVLTEESIPKLMMLRGKMQHLESATNRMLEIIKDGTKQQREMAKWIDIGASAYSDEIGRETPRPLTLPCDAALGWDGIE